MEVAFTPPDLLALGLPPDVPLLLCPGQPFKYAPAHDRLWAEISRRAQPARLVFFDAKDSVLSRRLADRLRATYRKAGLRYESCVTFVPFQDRQAFFGLMKRAHVLLDTVGFSGFNTAMQAIECGLPIVAREGTFLRGRLGSGVLRHMGLDDLVATTDDAYVDLAVSLTRDDTRRAETQRRIAARRGALFGDIAPVRALEDFLSGAVNGLSASATATGTPA
jgi:predicted O-linked N-acetylglucosamine transferase (SPINDLY family)